MTWAFLDDRANENEKLQGAGADAAWYWACGLMYCRRREAERKRRGERLDFIPLAASGVLFPVANPRKLIKRLLDSRLWEEVPGGYVVHDYGHVYGTSGPAEPSSGATSGDSSAGLTPDQRNQRSAAGRARAAAGRRGPAGRFSARPAEPPAEPADSRARQDPDPTPDPMISDQDRPKDLTASARVEQRSVGPIRCPADLALTEAQRATLRMNQGLTDRQLDVMTADCVARWVVDEHKTMPLSGWRKLLGKAISRDANSAKRPRLGLVADQSDDADGAAELAAIEQERAEFLRQRERPQEPERVPSEEEIDAMLRGVHGR